MNLEVSLPGNPTTVYVSMWVKRSAGWSDNGNAMTKHFFIWADQTGDHGFVAITYLQEHFFALETAGNGNQFDYYGPVEDAYGSWRRYEYVFKMNSAGNADGTFTAWRNGVQIMNRTGIRWVAAGVTPGFTRVQWSPTYGGGSNRVPATQYIDVDQFYISTK